MNPLQSSIGPTGNLVVKSEIDGITNITISDRTLTKIGQSKFKVYNGFVKSGAEGSQGVEACIFPYKCQGGVNQMAHKLHQQCSAFDHPNVMRSLGYGRGAKNHSQYMFVAFPKFTRTFNDYIQKGSSAIEMGRFSQSFIQIISDIVHGLDALNKHGFDCPALQGSHIAIMEDEKFVTAKIWNFSACDSDKIGDGAWIELGRMLMDTAVYNNGYSPESLEINDLCRKMINGKLRGTEILGHSALLCVQEKFDNVLVVWNHVSVNCKPQLVQQGHGQGVVENQQVLKTVQIARTLNEYLDLKVNIPNRPIWINNIRQRRTPWTFRELLDELRDIIEHENEYIPPALIEEYTNKQMSNGKKMSDLESWIRKSWAEYFLRIQLWSSNLTAKLK